MANPTVILLFIFAVRCRGISMWPQPRTMSWPVHSATPLSPSFAISSPYHRYLSVAANRYLKLIKTENYHPLVPQKVNLTNGPSLQTLIITVNNLAAPLTHGVNESYSLSIPMSGNRATLIAETAWGAMRGLETFRQLVWGKPRRVAAGVEVVDWPIYAYRGVMLDTSRNYYDVKDILRTIGAMSANKFNVFHWHITDAESFPVVLPSEPDLAAKGSYGSEFQYSPADISRIIEYGLQHGVRVLPEINAPAHTGSWAGAYPEIVTCSNMFWWPAGSNWADRLASQPGTGHLNPLNPKTYQVMKNVIDDVTEMFPDSFYHAGADEIIPGCWKADPLVQSYLAKNGTLSQLLELFVKSTLPYILSQNRTVVYWEDILLDSNIKVRSSLLPTEHVILHTWGNGPNNTKKVVSSGYRTIVSSSDFYFLDCGHGSFLGNNSQYDQPPFADQGKGGSWCSPFKTWQMIYNYDIAYNLTEEEAKLVLGGEAVLWSELADPEVLDPRLWPRASALAEVLWSGNRDEMGKKRYAAATDRLNEWRYRMVGRGVRAEPIQPRWCINNPGMCNTVHPFT
ncbi:hypothetical protein MLD38_021886 [Melastoma candidum]|uniref:Uncharacterized protein n=1 Tax=Melastoma candidum TaxID=119954 RepID=A0ACB9QHI9_9MYRT|nr:hypothetical protein MLD38_021886 [Melastoma candidum]